jgi:hypothetical protein
VERVLAYAPLESGDTLSARMTREAALTPENRRAPCITNQVTSLLISTQAIVGCIPKNLLGLCSRLEPLFQTRVLGHQPRSWRLALIPRHSEKVICVWWNSILQDSTVTSSLSALISAARDQVFPSRPTCQLNQQPPVLRAIPAPSFRPRHRRQMTT